MTSVHQRYDGRILKKECVSLARNGYDVTLIVADNKNDEVYNGVKIISIKFMPRNRLDRILNAKKMILNKALSLDAHIYHFHDPELIPVGLALMKKGKKVIYDSHEDTPGDIKARYWIPVGLRNIISYVFTLYEHYAAKKFNAVITVTPFIVKRLKKHNKNTVMITNYPILNNDVVHHKCAAAKRQICFTGMIDPMWSHDTVLKALAGGDIKYILAGKVVNDYLSHLQECDREKHLEYIGVLPFEEVPNVHCSSIAGMAILKPAPSDTRNEGTLGNQKIFEYMNSGIPVICSNCKLWKEIITKYNCGICVDYDNIGQIHDAILSLVNNPQKAYLMGCNGKHAIADEYNWKTQEEILINLYKSLAQR